MPLEDGCWEPTTGWFWYMNEKDHTPHVFLGRRCSRDGFLALDQETRRRHIYSIGSTGAGKTTFLQCLINQDIHAGRGMCLIDPHGDLAEDIIDNIPRHRINDVVYFDASDRDYPIGFNPLAGWVEDHERELVASQLVSTFKGLWSDSWGEWLEYLLKNTLMALLERRGVAVSLLSIMRMLEDAEYRTHILAGVRDPVVLGFWQDYFNGFDQREQHMRISSTLNKAGKLVLSQVLRNIVGQTKSSFDMTDIMDNSKILIVNLSKGKIGEDNANFLGSLLVSDIVGRAMKRANQKEHERTDFYLYIDEFQNFTTDSFASIVSEARKYRLSLNIAHQNFDQITPKVLSAIIKNTGTLAAFNVNFEDAEKLAANFHPIKPDALANSSTGEFWCRTSGQVEMVAGFAPVEQEFLGRGSAGRVVRNTRRRYGQDKRCVQKDFEKWWG